MERTRGQDRFEVPEDQTRDAVDGSRDRRRFRKGTQISLGLAARFGYVDPQPAGMARPGDDQPDVAPDDSPAGRPAEEADAEEAPKKKGSKSKSGPEETTEGAGPSETAGE